MEKLLPYVNKLIESESKIVSVAIIEGEKDIVYTTENWDISQDIDKINSIWDLGESSNITISGLKCVIIQNTTEKLVAITLKNSQFEGGIVGFKDDERKIICKTAPDGHLLLGFTETSKIIRKLSSKKPYMDLDKELGKVEELKWATPRILLDDTENLQRLGLLKVGLSLDEAKVYLALLKKGDDGDRVGNLNKELDVKRTTIYRIMERLVKKNWVDMVLDTPKGAQIYVAHPLNSLMDNIIKSKEDELKILKSFRFIMGENLENGWIDLSEIKKDLQIYSQKAFDFKTLGMTGVEKDCGLILFEYDKEVNQEVIIRAALQLSSEKIRENIQPDLKENEFTIPDLEAIKIEDTKIQDYLGMIMSFKFREGTSTANNIGTDWIVAARHVAVPIDDKIYVIWGSEEKFPILLSIILRL
ncbi:MAG: helix-turn-helix domain-containing protein [Candidatus Hermodarchaeota archaeon]